MNNTNETYSYNNNNLKIDTSQSNNYYNNPIKHNYTFSTLNPSLFTEGKDKLIHNLKKTFIKDHMPNYSRNFFGINYMYNQKKVMSLHKNMKSISKKWKNYHYENAYKSINSLHKNSLKNKILQTTMYKSIEKTANDNYLKQKNKKKKNTFITTIEEDDDIKNNKLFIELNPSINNNESEKIKSYNDLNINNLSLSHYYSRNKSFNKNILTNISLPCITFSGYLNSLNTNPNHRSSLAQTCLSKLRIEVINQQLNESYKTFFEKRDFPVGLTESMFRFYLKNQKYFLFYDDLIKRYLYFLENEIKNNIIILGHLTTQRDKLLKENEVILKKILNLEDQIRIYESFNNIYLNFKNDAKIISPSLPNKIPIKSKIEGRKSTYIPLKRSSIKSPIKRLSNISKRKELFKRRETQQKITFKYSKFGLQKKQSLVSGIPKKARELFKNTQEIQEIFEEKDKSVFKAYNKYINVVYNLGELSLEHDKEKESINKNPDLIEIFNALDRKKRELIILKIKNRDLMEYKNSLINKRKEEKNEEDENDGIYGNSYEIIIKLKEILLNIPMNLEKILNIKNLYGILKEKSDSHYLYHKGKVYTKELFLLKALELFYLKIELWKKKCLDDKNLRGKFIQIKAERDKEMKYLKCEQNLMEEKINEMKKNKAIINKNNKIIVLRNRKFDPFYKKYIGDVIIRKRMKSKEYLDKLKQGNENEKYNNYLYY